MGTEEYKFDVLSFFSDIIGGITHYIPTQLILLITFILVYIFIVHIPTKIYIKRGRKEESKDINILMFVVSSLIYIVVTYLSVIIFNYASIEYGVEKVPILFGYDMDILVIKVNMISVLVAATLQMIINIIYTNTAIVYIKSNLYNKTKYIYMSLFFIMGALAYFILTIGYFGFLKTINFEYDLLKYVSYTSIYTTLILYPIFLFRDIKRN